jgi:hypothetical protein
MSAWLAPLACTRAWVHVIDLLSSARLARERLCCAAKVRCAQLQLPSPEMPCVLCCPHCL